MKKITEKQRSRDIRAAIDHRKQGTPKGKTNNLANNKDSSWLKINQWFNQKETKGLNFTKSTKRAITINLPDKMNFSDNYELTTLAIAAIRKITSHPPKNKKQYRLKRVNFDNLKKISSSAALVLTAELSKWDDLLRSNLTPQTKNWNDNILKQFIDLGFFELFKKSPELPKTQTPSNPVFVKYIKGSCGDSNKTRELKEEIKKVVGDDIAKWTFLHSGLTEAVTNVSHHAYPNHKRLKASEKSWYLTGAYDAEKQDLKICFYDQGVGIPRSLPKSEIWERVLGLLANFGLGKKLLDATLLKAAMEIDRTSTGENDRGKGLQDLLEFIKQRGEGYLSVVSRRGLYRYSIKNGNPETKMHSFESPLPGTLIIWNVSLAR